MKPGGIMVLLLLAAVVLPTAASAAETAVFHDGRTLRIAAHRLEGNRVTLQLEGGGELTLPIGRLRSIRRLPDRPGGETVPPRAPESDTSSPPLPGSPVPHRKEPVGERYAPVETALLFPRIAELALRYGLDAQLVAAVALVESGLDPAAVSPRGAQGLMQLMPSTASEYGVRDPFDVDENLEAGIAHLKRLLERYEGDLELALAGYNAGEGAVARYGGVPPFPETVRYIRRVLALARAD